MKIKLAWIGMLSLALGACDKEDKIATGKTPAEAAGQPGKNQPGRSFQGTPVAPRVPLAPPREPLVETLSQVIEPLTTPPETKEELEARRTAALEERKARITSRLNEQLKQRDSNNDGKLGRDEVQGPLKQRFTEADGNGDGFLSPDEQQTMVLSIAERFGESEPRRRFRGGGGSSKDP